jgi:hypothetical protein
MIGISLCTLLSLASAGSAGAATIITPMIEKDGGDSAFRCFVVNAGKKPVDFTVELRNDLGTAFQGPLAFSNVEPGEARILASGGLQFFGYCVVEGAFSRKAMRVSFCTVPQGAFDCVGTVVGQ